MKQIGKLAILVAAAVVFAVVTAHAGETETAVAPMTLTKLVEEIDGLEKKEIVFTGTIIGACKSGCKMWVAEGGYEEGDFFALVRAKDDAFKFDTDSSGKTVVMHGFAVAKYLDYCSESKTEQEGAMDKCATPVALDKESKEEKAHACASPEAHKEHATKQAELKDITFFATKVEYK